MLDVDGGDDGFLGTVLAAIGALDAALATSVRACWDVLQRQRATLKKGTIIYVIGKSARKIR